jgi:heat shock protein HslJ
MRSNGVAITLLACGATLLVAACQPRTEAPKAAPQALSLDTLAGTEWVLRAWDLEEPAPAEPEVTLAYQDGRVEGASGCNRYTAAAKAGATPGDLTVGPAAGTRMACPEPQSAVETRFLKQLGGAKKFGFLLGRLALSYEKDGGAFGTMLFEGRTPAATAKP